MVCVTSDKCYGNRDWDWGYGQNDELGGLDPYSSSKACQELVVASYRDSLMRRHGNRDRPGWKRDRRWDWAEHRLVPDMMHAAVEGAQ
jgi:CDP-glucose 4,6-dehydratase